MHIELMVWIVWRNAAGAKYLHGVYETEDRARSVANEKNKGVVSYLVYYEVSAHWVKE